MLFDQNAETQSSDEAICWNVYIPKKKNEKPLKNLKNLLDYFCLPLCLSIGW